MTNSIVNNPIPDDLNDILQDCWLSLFDAAQSAAHPLHTATIATINDTFPELRTVVLRAVVPTEATIVFHTDFRSPKIDQIRENNSVSWLFYDTKSRLQIRLKTTASIHNQDEIAQKSWDESRIESKKCYLVSPAPSSIVLFPTDGLPQNFKIKDLSEDDMNRGYEHFTVVRNKVHEIDWLLLNHSGHRRAKFVIDDQTTKYSWIIP